MLNELKTLSDSMSKNGVSPYEWHKDFKPIKVTSPCYVISLTKQGKIDSIRLLDNVGGLRTWQGGANGDTFPAFNYTPSFFKKSKNAKINDTDKVELVNFLNQEGDAELPESIISLKNNEKINKKRLNKINKCLKAVSEKFFSFIPEKDSDLLCKFKGSFKAMLQLCSNEESFVDLIEDYFLNHTSDEIMSLVCSAKPYNEETLDSVVLFFDLADTSDGSIASERAMRDINEMLANVSANSTNEAMLVTDAFGFVCDESETKDKMPEVKLPGTLSNTKLRSMNHESLCQYRYGHISSDSFPVGNEIRRLTKAALEWISDKDREGLTWDKVGGNEIIFAYPKSLPRIPPPLARMMGNGANAGIRFAKCAADTIEKLRGHMPNKTNSIELEVFAIQKADKARRKIVFYRDYSVDMLQAAVEEWIMGSQNMPSFSIRKWPEKKSSPKDNNEKSKPEELRIDAPYPLSVSDICYRAWRYKGDSKNMPKCEYEYICEKIPYFLGLELFLSNRESVESLSKRLLTLLLQNGDSFFKATGNASHLGEVISSGQNSSYLEKSLSIIGILLYKLGIRKESYMKETPYQIGRMLNLADGLHKLYCEVERNKDKLPAELLGATFYTAASTNPIQAFATLGIRMKPYLAWAKTNKSEKTALSHWYLSEFAKVSDAISMNGLPSKMNDLDKAQMLLGYLASSKQSDNSTDVNLVTSKEGE